MKKLLSLLSVLTISGTAVPTTIAVSSYKKEEFKLENNLEILNMVKRGNNKNKKLTKNITSTIDGEDNRPSTSITNNNKCGGSARSRSGINNKCLKPSTAINDGGSELKTKTTRDRILN